MKGALTEIIQLATLDSDPWVLMVADILKSFPDTGSLNLDLEEQNPNVQDILGELREKGTSYTCLVYAQRRELGLPENMFSKMNLTVSLCVLWFLKCYLYTPPTPCAAIWLFVNL